MKLWQELKRRNVFRVAAAYAVVGWLLIEIADTVFPRLMLPEWSVTLVIALLAIGLPIALVLSWAYELTPEGVKRAEDVEPTQSITPLTGRKLDFVIIGVLVLALGWFAWDKFFAVAPSSETASAGGDPSIAVLPFADMSPDGDQEYFSDGLSEEVLNLLAQIKELKVIGRTSSFAFKGRNVDLREIGDQLGAAYILEGSVRKAGEQLRITAQLIEAEDGSHLWSESYDRRLENVFAIQDDIAGAIVKALEVSLTGSERKAADEHGTDSMPAYERFLEARRLIQQRGRSSLEAAGGLLDEALERDPDYAPALAARAQVALMLSDTLGAYGEIPLTEAVAEAEPLIERALDLNPELATAHAVRGLKFVLLRKFTQASDTLARALELNPSHADALNWRMSTSLAAGRLDETIVEGRRAAEIDPLNLVARGNVAAAHVLAGQTQDALETVASLQRDFSDNPLSYLRASEALSSSGRLAEAVPPAENALDLAPNNPLVETSAGALFLALGQYERVLALPESDHGAALLALDRSDEALVATRIHLNEASDAVDRLNNLLQTLSLAGRHDEVLAFYTERWGSPEAVEHTFGTDSVTAEMAAITVSLRALDRADAFDEALAHWGQRLEFMREHGYAYSGFVINEARHAALSGNRAQAIETLTHAIDLGYRNPLLARDPAFAELAEDPDFQAQVERMTDLINAEREKLDLEPLP